ncbi:MAG: hypothetical protein V1661_03565 [bacterium]
MEVKVKHHKDHKDISPLKKHDDGYNFKLTPQKPPTSEVKMHKFICQNPHACDDGKRYEWEVPVSCASETDCCPNCGSPVAKAMKKD